MSGTFCVVANLMEEIKTNQDVDVFRSVRLVRTNRPQFICSLVSIKTYRQFKQRDNIVLDKVSNYN